jgi:general secretion pathway protein I
LVEALAALAVLAAGLAAIGALSSTSLRASLDAERHLAHVSAAQKILAGLPARNALPFGRLTGVLDNYAWRIDSNALATTDPQRSAEWTPEGIALLVRSPSGSIMEIDTIRLRRMQTR